MNKLTNYERGYLEALLDGEGCISLYQTKSSYKIATPSVCITNTDLNLIKKAQKMLGSHGSIRKTSYRKHLKVKDVY
jgi:hypothetical protein